MSTTTSPSPSPAKVESQPASSLLRMGVAGALVGAAAIHFAYAPAHLDAETSHGLFFVTVAWLQLGAAAMIGLGQLPRKLALLATAALNAGIIGVWVVSRTVGIGGHDESMAFPDVAATVLEVSVIAGCVALAAGTFARKRVPGTAFGGVAGALVVALVALVSASLVPELSGGHGSGGRSHGEEANGVAADDGGHDHGGSSSEANGAAAPDAGGHDHGGGGAEATSAASMSPEEFADHRLEVLTGNLPADEVAARREASRQLIAKIIRERSQELKALPEAEREQRIEEFTNWVIDNALTAEHQSGGDTGNHADGPSEWQWMEDPAERLELEEQLKVSGTVVDRFPTAADAMNAGYRQVTTYVPGIGAHYINLGHITGSGFDEANPEMLLYNGEAPESELVGVSYAVFGAEAPEGFAGPNDTWHVHPSLCMVGLFVVGPDSTPEEACQSVGGEKGTPSPGGELWMMHLWQVPGWESPWGLFSGENPNLNLATADPIPQV